ncbi:hypothetical protein [Leadbettera azotonutricia]|uniref:Lipoprotein n=1 Tax=Leadbettera azotonutricia (strain ATCC BAA-888 / DSM 13862 / ZAS-9) TaxID=545695 RepID=F5YBC1_LEAAZ|nr:hypothetical protein [Leadbettera azotonutricia]AEF82625.1 hypothetical protein TREAZ_1889 [Leadbettera azotonutricia ZAS-9]
MKSAKNSSFVLIIAFSLLFPGCASIQANKDLNTKPEDLLRGDPSNPVRVQEYLQGILANPKGYEVKAFERRAFSANTKKNLFMVHSFYVFFKNDSMEHTLVFTATPKGSELDGCWMLDAETDTESYGLFISSDNPWEVEEYKGKHGETTLNTVQTTQNILARLDKGYTFFGPASARNLAWYHQVWMFLVPPPIITYAPLLLVSIHSDNCTSAVLETMAWEQ